MANLAFGASAKTQACTSTLTSILGVKTPANQAVTLDEVDCGLDGTNSAQVPGIIDIGTCTFAASPPNTNSTNVVPVASDSGRPETIQSICARLWTTQPTVISIWKSFLVPTYMGSALAPLPMNKPCIAKGGNGVILSVTLGASVTANLTGTLLCTE